MKDINSQLYKIMTDKYDQRRKYKVPIDEKIWDNVEELKQFLSKVSNPSHKIYWTLMAWTGIRSCECKNITIKDFDFKNEELSVLFKYLNTKGLLFKNQTNMRKEFRNQCSKLGDKYNRHYAINKQKHKLYFFTQHSLRRFFQTLVANHSELIGRTIHDTETIARRHHYTPKEKIRTIINKLY